LDPDTSACQITSDPAGSAFDIGEWVSLDATGLQYIDPSQPGIGVMYQMAGAQTCYSTGRATNYWANVIVS
jgi:hypothetical protein